jgi:hypothetical protein
MMQIARNHHFVPQAYLAGFTDTGTKKGRLYAFDLVDGRCFRPKPRNVAFEVDFNRFEAEGQPPDALEKAFGEFEGKASSVIRAMCREGHLPCDEEFSYVLNLICLLATRNPRLRNSMTIARRHTARIISELLVANRATYERQIAASRGAGFVPDKVLPFERMKALVERDDYQIEISTAEHLQSEIRVFDRILKSLGPRHWSLLIATPDAPDFITCDHPANLVPKQVVFPIDARNAVLGVVDNSPWPRRVDFSALSVAEVNARIVDQARRQIYSRGPEVAVLHENEVVVIRSEQIIGQAGRQK